MRRTSRIGHGRLSTVIRRVLHQAVVASTALFLASTHLVATPWEGMRTLDDRRATPEPSDLAEERDGTVVIADGSEAIPPDGTDTPIDEPTQGQTANGSDALGVFQTLYETLGMEGWIGDATDGGTVETAGHETFGGFLHPHDTCKSGFCPTWRGSVDALLLWQGNLASRPIYRDYDGTSVGAVALNANQLMPSLSAGPRYGILFQFDPCWSVEGNYFRVTPFDSERSVTGNPELAEVDVFGFDDEGFDDATVSGWGEVQSAECNLRHRHCQSPTTWLAGFRWVQLDQHMLIQEEGLFDDPDFFADFSTRVGNDLYGGQVGFDTMVWNDCQGPIQINVLGKAGVFANIAYQSVLYEDSDGDFGELDASTTATSFFGELGVNATYRLTSWLGWRAGYTLFWASGVATPVGQLSANNLSSGVARIDMSGSVLLHGATTGVEARW